MNNLQGIDIVKLLIVVDELNVQPLASINISLNFCIKILDEIEIWEDLK